MEDLKSAHPITGKKCDLVRLVEPAGQNHMTKKWERTASCRARSDSRGVRLQRAGSEKQHLPVQKGMKLKSRHPEGDREGGRRML